ncbi:hypothetical protein Q4504_00620 [Mesomycoplasma ovipneumoniae]|uniref:hypothetical protein n=1 Tax=Mesomycoplasma ovipneumoniae TaxID=29562 RepID=UPI0026E1923D|nr:hypothetical protein [Mesomycoplasma ovipneumoniae]MDO6856972.1 hypothetical protein [Mesomycoplasma ovipneumoniae]
MKKQLIDLLKEKDIELESQSFKLEQISEIQEELKNVIGSDWNQWPVFKKNFFIEYFTIVIVWANKICESPLTPNYTKKSYYQNFFKLTENKKLPKMAEQLKIDLWKIGRWIPYFYYVNLVHEILENHGPFHNKDGGADINKKNKLFDSFVDYGGCQSVSWDYPNNLSQWELNFIEDGDKKTFLTEQEGAKLEYFYFLFIQEKNNQFLEYYNWINRLFEEWETLLEHKWIEENIDISEIKEIREMKTAESLIDNEKDLYVAVEKARKAKQLTSLMLSTSDMVDIMKSISRTKQNILFQENSSKYYKYWNLNKKNIDEIYKKVLNPDHIHSDKKNKFDSALNEVRKFEINYNEAIAHKPKAIVKKEQQELFLASQNYILKKSENFMDLTQNKNPKAKANSSKSWIQIWF